MNNGDKELLKELFKANIETVKTEIQALKEASVRERELIQDRCKTHLSQTNKMYDCLKELKSESRSGDAGINAKIDTHIQQHNGKLETKKFKLKLGEMKYKKTMAAVALLGAIAAILKVVKFW